MTSPLPEPLTPAGCDLRDYPSMLLDVGRLRDCSLARVPNAEVFRTAVLSWCAAWHQVPAGSLPNDDHDLAHLLGYGRALRRWKKMRADGGLHGWILCADGRLYHPVVAEKVVAAIASKAAQKARTEAARVARNENRTGKPRTETQAQSGHASDIAGKRSSVTEAVADAVTASKVREEKVSIDTGSLRSPAAAAAGEEAGVEVGSQVGAGSAVAAAVVDAASEVPEQTAGARAASAPALPADPFGKSLFGAEMPSVPAKGRKGVKAPAEDDGPPVPRTPKAILFSDGLRACADMAGVSPESLRTWMVVYLRDHAQNDAARALQPIMAAHAKWVRTGDGPGNIKSAMIDAVRKLGAGQGEDGNRAVPETAGTKPWVVAEVVTQCNRTMRVHSDNVWGSGQNLFSHMIADALNAGADPVRDIYPVMREAAKWSGGAGQIQGLGWFKSKLRMPPLKVVA